jgi:hypothetical protein
MDLIFNGRAFQEDCLTPDDGPIAYPETSVHNEKHTPRNNLEEPRPEGQVYFLSKSGNQERNMTHNARHTFDLAAVSEFPMEMENRLELEISSAGYDRVFGVSCSRTGEHRFLDGEELITKRRISLRPVYLSIYHSKVSEAYMNTDSHIFETATPNFEGSTL